MTMVLPQTNQGYSDLTTITLIRKLYNAYDTAHVCNMYVCNITDWIAVDVERLLQARDNRTEIVLTFSEF